MFQPLDGPAVEDEITITDSTVVELKVGTNPLEERKVITFQAQGGKVRYGWTNGISSTVGFKGAKDQIITIEASYSQSVYIISESGSVTVYFAERA